MTERRIVGWSAGIVLLTALIAWLFTPSALFGFRLLFTSGPINGFETSWWAPYLAPGLIVVGAVLLLVVSFVLTSRFGAPAQVWYIVLAWAVAYVFMTLAPTAPSLVMAQRPDPMVATSEILLRAVGRTPFVRWDLLLMAVVTYPLGSWIGCEIGARRAGHSAHA